MGLVTALVQALNADRFDVSFSLSLSLCLDKGVCWEKDERHARQVLFKSSASAYSMTCGGASATR